MTTTNTANPTAIDLWTVIKKEITGIQLLWGTVNGMYFQPQGKEWQALRVDAPIPVYLIQTALMESLLMRVSRMMDPAATGKLTNLSLKQLVIADAKVDADEKTLRAVWDDSGLKEVRDKYLSHNDQSRSLSADHTLNIPLKRADIEALQKLAEGLRTLRCDVNPKLGCGAYLDKETDLSITRHIDALVKSLLGGRLFFELLPALRCALESVEMPQ